MKHNPKSSFLKICGLPCFGAMQRQTKRRAASEEGARGGAYLEADSNHSRSLMGSRLYALVMFALIPAGGSVTIFTLF